MVWLDRISAKAHWIALLLTLIGTARIVATYDVFHHTIDEGFHIACGLEWITRGTYKIEAQHPPLARVLAAIGPWKLNAKLIDDPRADMYDQALSAFYSTDANYDGRLRWARAAMLPAFWLLCWVVWAACARWFSRLIALGSVVFLTTMPAILAHSGLATTDAVFTATFCGLMAATMLLVERPAWKTGVLFGVALGLALVSKFSTLAFVPSCLAAALLFAWPGKKEVVAVVKRTWKPALAGGLLALFIVWAAFRFSYGPARTLSFHVPAPEFFNGIEEARQHNEIGHDSWLLGEFSKTGFWYYYPAALLFKTPVAFQLLVIPGIWLLFRSGRKRDRVVIGLMLGMIAFSVTSHINIGVRHVLPVYVFAAVMAAATAEYLLREWKRRWTAGMLTGLLAWQVGTSAMAHPDYLAYFNFLAGSKPEEVLVDSDLDWGQDMKRLIARLNQLGVKQFAFDPAIYGLWVEYHGMPQNVPLNPDSPRPGWNAVSLTFNKLTRMNTREKNPTRIIWTDYTEPTERVGKGILLYYQPPAK